MIYETLQGFFWLMLDLTMSYYSAVFYCCANALQIHILGFVEVGIIFLPSLCTYGASTAAGGCGNPNAYLEPVVGLELG